MDCNLLISFCCNLYDNVNKGLSFIRLQEDNVFDIRIKSNNYLGFSSQIIRLILMSYTLSSCNLIRCPLLTSQRRLIRTHQQVYQPNVHIVLCGAFIYYMLSTGGSKPPCAILFGNDLRVGLHIFVLSILKLQNAKDEKS